MIEKLFINEVEKIAESRFANSPIGKNLKEINLDELKANYAKLSETLDVDLSDKNADDNGKPIRDDNGDLLFGNTFAIDGKEYSTDDDGCIYRVDGALLPNNSYKLNGNIYKTDDNGHIIDSDSKNKIGSDILPAADTQEQRGFDDKDEQPGDNNDVDISDKDVDDNGDPIKDKDGNFLPNKTFIIDGIKYSTDDEGKIYCKDDKLLPNTTYKLNGNIYTTDHHGNITDVQSGDLKLSSDIPRDTDAQRKVGGEDRRPNDQGGHIIGNNLGGDSGLGNLIPMEQRINQSDYKRMENEIAAAKEAGKEVTVHITLTYTDGSKRPDKIIVTVTIDGKKTVYKFDNNMDGSLINDVPENGKEVVQDKLDETGGTVSSIKEQYDENGNLVSTTVYITYTGEDGKTYSTAVVIDNQKGSEV